MPNRVRTCAILLWLLVFALCPSLSAEERPSLAITHVVIIDGNGKAPIEDGTLIVRDGKIETVGPASNIKVPADAKVIEGRGAAVMPGLADMHAHLTGGWDGISSDLLGFPKYLNALLYSGVTTVLDTGNVQDYILQMRQEVAAGRLLGPRIYCAGALIDGQF
jgi:imidazolonepropionase-like amidohydrolase